MKSCLLFLLAVLLFTDTRAQEDSTAPSPQNGLLSFEVKPVEKVVVLKWAIENGWDYKSFDIERSEDGISFAKVGSRLGISKNNEGEYDLVDATPKRGAPLQYRLKLISTDGFVLHSAVKETKVTDSPWSVRLKQNPVRNNIELEMDVPGDKQASVVVISNSGQPVITQTFRLQGGKNHLSITTQDVSAGLYQLMVELGGERKTFSFIKE